MYLSALFLIYIAAAFLALLGIGIVLLLISREKNRQSRQYRVVMCFAVVVFVQCVLYLYFYYRDMILGNEAVNVFLRIIDYCLCGSIFFFWLNVMDVLDDVKHRFRRTWAYILGALIALPGTVATAFFMDEYYFFSSDAAGRAYIIIEISTVVLTAIVTSKYALDFVRSSLSRYKRIYVAVVAVALLVWDIQQIFVDWGLYSGLYKSAWTHGVMDTTGAATAIVSCATFIYLFKEDFSPLFYVAEEKKDEDPYPAAVETAAQQHRLTVRETDVLRLVCQGKNNPEIAEALFISVNTVKKHLKNIFEKMGVSTRMELMYIVNRKDDEIR